MGLGCHGCWASGEQGTYTRQLVREEQLSNPGPELPNSVSTVPAWCPL